MFRQAKQQVLNEDLLMADDVLAATLASNQAGDQALPASVLKSPNGHSQPP